MLDQQHASGGRAEFRPEWMTGSRAPARQAIADKQFAIDSIEQGALEVRATMNRAQATVRDAEAAVRAADAESAEINRLELQELVENAKSGTPVSPKTQRMRAAAETRAAECRRRADLARQVLAQVTIPHDAARQGSVAMQKELGPLACAVMAELHADAMVRMRRARQDFVAAEIEVRSIANAIAQEGRRLQDSGHDGSAYFLAAAPLAQAFADEPGYQAPTMPELYRGSAQWSDFLGRLIGDPDVLPPAPELRP
jgi:hypothetical protein